MSAPSSASASSSYPSSASISSAAIGLFSFASLCLAVYPIVRHFQLNEVIHISLYLSFFLVLLTLIGTFLSCSPSIRSIRFYSLAITVFFLYYLINLLYEGIHNHLPLSSFEQQFHLSQVVLLLVVDAFCWSWLWQMNKVEEVVFDAETHGAGAEQAEPLLAERQA